MIKNLLFLGTYLLVAVAAGAGCGRLPHSPPPTAQPAEAIPANPVCTQIPSPSNDPYATPTCGLAICSQQDRIRTLCEVRQAILTRYSGAYVKPFTLHGFDAAHHLDLSITEELQVQDNDQLRFLDRLRGYIAGFNDSHLDFQTEPKLPLVTTGFMLREIEGRFFITKFIPKALESLDPILKNRIHVGAEVRTLDGETPGQIAQRLSAYIDGSSAAYIREESVRSITKRDFKYPAQPRFKVVLADEAHGPTELEMPWIVEDTYRDRPDTYRYFNDRGILGSYDLGLDWYKLDEGWSIVNHNVWAGNLEDAPLPGSGEETQLAEYTYASSSHPKIKPVAYRLGILGRGKQAPVMYMQLLTFSPSKVAGPDLGWALMQNTEFKKRSEAVMSKMSGSLTTGGFPSSGSSPTPQASPSPETATTPGATPSPGISPSPISYSTDIAYLEPIRMAVQIAKSFGLNIVLDLRLNSGGRLRYPRALLSLMTETGKVYGGTYLASRVTPTARLGGWSHNSDGATNGNVDYNNWDFNSSIYEKSLQAGERFTPFVVAKDIGPDPEVGGYNGRVVVLTTPSCVSACDQAAALFKKSGRAKLLGAGTNGTGLGFLDLDSLATWTDSYALVSFTIPDLIFGSLSRPVGASESAHVLSFKENATRLLSENLPNSADISVPFSSAELLAPGSTWLQAIQQALDAP